jgi:hypothetical protein
MHKSLCSINIEREALKLSLIDLSQAFGMMLPISRVAVSGAAVHKRSTENREDTYLKSETMTEKAKRDT